MSGVNFSINRPGAPSSRAGASNGPRRSTASASVRPARPFDSDEDDEAPRDELVSGFDRKGAVRANQTAAQRKAAEAPMIIPSLPNKAWLQPKKELYKPDAATMRGAKPAASAGTGGEGVDVVGQSTGSGGLRVGDLKSEPPSGAPSPSLAATQAMAATSLDTPSSIGALTPASAELPATPFVESEDQRAFRELLAGTGDVAARPQIDIILPADGSRGNELLNGGREMNELENFRASLQSLPDMASLEDYERVPIGQFGAALLRGMSRSAGTATVSAKVPEARPDFLGLGAKPMPAAPEANGRPGSKPKKKRRDANPYMPLVKRAIEGSQQNSGSSAPATPLALADKPYDSERSSHRSSLRSSPRRSDDEDEEERRRRRRRREREERDRDGRRDSDRDRDRDRDRKERQDRGSDSARSSRRNSRSRSPRRDDRDRRRHN